MLDRNREFAVPRYQGEFASLIGAAVDQYRINVKDGDKTHDFIPFGGITYRKGSRLLLFGQGNGIKLSTAVTDIDTQFNPQEFGPWATRFIELPDYEDIVTTQVDTQGADIHQEPSLKGPSTVIIRLPYQHPVTNQRASLPLEEQEFLQVFAGEQGQIARFHGAGLPEEIALIWGREFRQSQYGMAFFIHPSGESSDPTRRGDDSDLNLKSLDGFTMLLKDLLAQYEDINGPHTPFVDKLNRALELGKIKLDSTAGPELLKMAVIARTRLGRAGPLLDSLLVGLDDGWKANLNFWKKDHTAFRSEMAKKMIDSIVEPKSVRQTNSQFESILGRQLMEAVGAEFMVRGEGMAAFLNQLTVRIPQTSDQGELTDFERIIADILKSAKSSQDRYFENKDGKYSVVESGEVKNDPTMQTIAETLKKNLAKRKAELAANRLKALEGLKVQKPIWETVKSPDLADLRKTIEEQSKFGTTSEIMDFYVKRLIETPIITLQDFDDVTILVKEIQSISYYKTNRPWSIQTNPDKLSAVLSKTNSYFSVASEIEKAMLILIKKRDQIVIQQNQPSSDIPPIFV